MTKYQEDLEAGINLLLEADKDYISDAGGHLADCDTLPGYFIMAAQGYSDKPELRIYQNRAIVAAYRAALREFKNGEFEDLAEAFREQI